MPVDRVSISTGRPHRPPLRRGRGDRPALLLLLGWVVGCDDSTGPAPCSASSVGVSASGGQKPTITWEAECEAQAVAVIDPVTGFDVWRVAADTRRIPKPVVYSVVPVGAKTLHTAEPLQPGGHYVVYVAIVVGRDTLSEIGGLTP